jgi:hypothetical protein
VGLRITNSGPWMVRSAGPGTHVERAQFYPEVKKQQEVSPKREGARFQEFQPLSDTCTACLSVYASRQVGVEIPTSRFYTLYLSLGQVPIRYSCELYSIGIRGHFDTNSTPLDAPGRPGNCHNFTTIMQSWVEAPIQQFAMFQPAPGIY